jgi:hypothetical protein
MLWQLKLDCTEVQKIELKQFDDEAKLLKKNNQTVTKYKKSHFQLENGIFYNKQTYSLDAKYLSASSAAIQPLPAAVIA